MVLDLSIRIDIYGKSRILNVVRYKILQGRMAESKSRRSVPTIVKTLCNFYDFYGSLLAKGRQRALMTRLVLFYGRYNFKGKTLFAKGR